MECRFVVGQKVVCIKEGEWYPLFGKAVEPGDFLPVRGEFYQIREIYADEYGVLLNFMEDPDPYQGFLHDRFRPLEERKTDISVFTKMLQSKELVNDGAPA